MNFEYLRLDFQIKLILVLIYVINEDMKTKQDKKEANKNSI